MTILQHLKFPKNVIKLQCICIYLKEIVFKILELLYVLFWTRYINFVNPCLKFKKNTKSKCWWKSKTKIKIIMVWLYCQWEIDVSTIDHKMKNWTKWRSQYGLQWRAKLIQYGNLLQILTAKGKNKTRLK